MKYKQELNQLILKANNVLWQREIKYTIVLSDYKICCISDNSDKFLSPRMSIKNLCNWLNGFIEGLEF